MLRKPPDEEELESALRRRLDESAQFKTSMILYLDRHRDKKSYNDLWVDFTRFLEEKRIKNNRDALEHKGGRKQAPSKKTKEDEELQNFLISTCFRRRPIHAAQSLQDILDAWQM